MQESHNENKKQGDEHLHQEYPCADADCSSGSRTGRSSTVLPGQKNQGAVNTNPVNSLSPNSENSIFSISGKVLLPVS